MDYLRRIFTYFNTKETRKPVSFVFDPDQSGAICALQDRVNASYPDQRHAPLHALWLAVERALPPNHEYHSMRGSTWTLSYVDRVRVELVEVIK